MQRRLFICAIGARLSAAAAPRAGRRADGRRGVRRDDAARGPPADQLEGSAAAARELHREHLLPRRPGLGQRSGCATSASGRAAPARATASSSGCASTSTATPAISASPGSRRSCSTTCCRIRRWCASRCRWRSSTASACRRRANRSAACSSTTSTRVSTRWSRRSSPTFVDRTLGEDGGYLFEYHWVAPFRGEDLGDARRLQAALRAAQPRVRTPTASSTARSAICSARRRRPTRRRGSGSSGFSTCRRSSRSSRRRISSPRTTASSATRG